MASWIIFFTKVYEKPWVTLKVDVEACANTIYNCTEAIANACNLLEPFIPFSSIKIKNWLGLKIVSGNI
jgi:methionyl-tRNA synthetase